MHVLIAPDKFKDALNAAGVAAAMAAGVRDVLPNAAVDECPLADGGEGTGRILAQACGAEARHATALDPLGRPRRACWWLNAANNEAIVEMAEASGICLLTPAERDATGTTSYGTGQLLAAAFDAGCRSILLAVGGSATVDGGAGCLQALGWKLIDNDGKPLARPAAGRDLASVAGIVPPRQFPQIPISVLCDVDNPLTGPRGAAAVFAPQKGAPPEQVELLDRALERWSLLLEQYMPRSASCPGAGAAGGLPAALSALCGAALRSGFAEVAERVELDRRLARCNLCLTGEGRLDEQTAGGKVVAGVARRAAALGVPVWAFVGAAAPSDPAALTHLASTLLLSRCEIVTPPGTPLDEALRRTPELLRRAVAAALGDKSRN